MLAVVFVICLATTANRQPDNACRVYKMRLNVRFSASYAFYAAQTLYVCLPTTPYLHP